MTIPELMFDHCGMRKLSVDIFSDPGHGCHKCAVQWQLDISPLISKASSVVTG